MQRLLPPILILLYFTLRHGGQTAWFALSTLATATKRANASLSRASAGSSDHRHWQGTMNTAEIFNFGADPEAGQA